MQWFQQVWPYGNGKSKMSNFFKSAALLMLFASVTIATSKLKDTPTLDTKAYSITSNCSNATFTNGIVSVADGSISSPSGVNFLDLGFPSVILVVGQDVSADIGGGLIRVCTHTSSVISNQTISTYTCLDNSFPACLINLTHLDN
jgi:hypothetical protein